MRNNEWLRRGSHTQNQHRKYFRSDFLGNSTPPTRHDELSFESKHRIFIIVAHQRLRTLYTSGFERTLVSIFPLFFPVIFPRLRETIFRASEGSGVGLRGVSKG